MIIEVDAGGKRYDCDVTVGSGADGKVVVKVLEVRVVSGESRTVQSLLPNDALAEMEMRALRARASCVVVGCDKEAARAYGASMYCEPHYRDRWTEDTESVFPGK